ncbi:MAG: disulfide bond formation protein B [Holosporales bacterium]|nr:disulfide bond formation protein B [Holosporales bacterium]
MLLSVRTANIVVFCVALALFLVSTSSEFFAGIQPCQLCLITRYLYLLVVVIAAGSLRWPCVKGLVLAVLFCTFAFGVYHLGVESHWWTGPRSCVAKLPTIDTMTDELVDQINDTKMYCDKVNWRIFGVSSTLWSCAIAALLLWIISVAYTLDFYMRKLERAQKN